MADDFLIDIYTVQIIEGEKSVIETRTTASLKGTENDYYITYDDQDDSSKHGKTIIHVENGNCVTIDRDADISSHMTIEKNVRHLSTHRTYVGTFTMGVSAVKIDSKINEDGGTLVFKYRTDIDMVPLAEFDFTIKIKKQ